MPKINKSGKSGAQKLLAKEMRDLIFQVVTSWQVIVVTVAFVLYCFLIGAVARLQRQPRIKIPSRSKKAAPVISSEPSSRKGNDEEDVEGEGEGEDELGLEE
jgi:hypothetical protein